MSILRSLLLRASRSPRLGRWALHSPISRRAVRRFMPGEDLGSALEAAAGFAKEGAGAVLTQLGENVTTPAEAAAVRDHYDTVFDAVRTRNLPAHVSIKLTQLGLDLDVDACAAHVDTLGDSAGGTMLTIDMEDSSYVDRTLAIYRRLRQRRDQAGVCLQAYLHRTPGDLEALMPLRPTVRLVKGAYRESPAVALQGKREVDGRYLELARVLLDRARAGDAFPIFGTHDMALVEEILAYARALGLSSEAWELHMLYGVRADDQRRLVQEGVTLRVLISYGTAWFPWYMRRLAEKPSNLWFVLRNIV